MKLDPPARPYRQKARARATEQTGTRILQAFMARMQSGWFDEIRLEDVAHEAGVTIQTVIRRFGSKEGLLGAWQQTLHNDILRERAQPSSNIGKAIDVIIAEYELRGALVMRLLAQEDRYEPIHIMAEVGRATHRAWVGEVFSPGWIPCAAPPVAMRTTSWSSRWTSTPGNCCVWT